MCMVPGLSHMCVGNYYSHAHKCVYVCFRQTHYSKNCLYIKNCGANWKYIFMIPKLGVDPKNHSRCQQYHVWHLSEGELWFDLVSLRAMNFIGKGFSELWIVL